MADREVKMESEKLKIIFFGTSEFGAIVLEKMVHAELRPVFVVTTPDKPAGRKQLPSPSPVKILAQGRKVVIFQPEEFGSDTQYTIQNTNPDIFVVAAYGKVLPKEILDIPRFGALNVHPSLLPKYRGPSPVQNTILNGDKETGVTIILMDEKIDHGAIVTNVKYQIPNAKTTYSELHNTLAELGADLLIQTIPQFIEGRIKPISQDDSKATYTRIFKREDGYINWGKSAEHIERQIRALNPWPGTYTKCQMSNVKCQNLKILQADILQDDNQKLRVKPGQVFLTQDKKLVIQTGENALFVEKLQLEGGKPMAAKDFLLGHRNFIGTILC